jgi:8-oxo-dGTP pyrophosphatase MutT (NUDIX family)
MHRTKLLNLLLTYIPTDEGEIYNKQQMLYGLNQYPDCFRRDCEIGHFTASCWLENYDGTQFLLTKHKKLGDWLQLGGHTDGDPDLLKVSLKEAHEESGLQNIKIVARDIFDIGYHLIPKYQNTPQHYHYDVVFLLRASKRDEAIQISNESEDLRWFSFPPTDNVGVNRMFKKWVNLRNQWNKNGID